MAQVAIGGFVGDRGLHGFGRPGEEGAAHLRSPARWTAAGVELTSDGGEVAEVTPGVAVVADARIDNRDELADQLGLVRTAANERLIAAAYLRWKEGCAARIEGDFAFVLWDASARKLLCARDPAGVRPLYYTRTGGAFRFAQSPEHLARSLGHRPALRDAAMADFLYGRVLDPVGTFYDGICRLEPGHLLLVRGGELSLRRYYDLAPAVPAAGDPAEEFRHLLADAVRRRAAPSEQVGALLSGGLDSSSIACLLRDQHRAARGAPVPVFSMVFREPERSNERPFVDHVLAGGGFASQVLELDDYRPLDELETLIADLGGPFLAPNLACLRPVVRAAAADGVTVLLEGHGGDEVVSHGYGLLGELAARRRWLRLWREARAAADNYGRSALSLTRLVARHQPGLDARIAARLLAPFDRAPPPTGTGPAHVLSRDLVERSDLRARLRAATSSGPAVTEQEHHRAVLTEPLQPYAFEVHAAFYRSLGVEARYPFWDRRLVEFCLGLPAEAKLANGWSRLILRRAMVGIVPEPVLRRRDKVDFTVHLARGLVRHHRARIDDLLAQGQESALAAYCDLAAARGIFAAICADPDSAPGREVQMVWRVVAMGMWLDSLRSPLVRSDAGTPPDLSTLASGIAA